MATPKGLRLVDTPSIVKGYWENYSDAVNAACENGKNVHSEVTQGSGGYYGTSFNEACRLAREGWPDGAKRITGLIENLNIAGTIKQPEIYFDVQGESGFDMGRIANGEPECVMDWRDSDIDITAQTPKVIRALINRASSDGIESEAACNRGAAILGLIDALEAAGKSVELWTVDACMFGAKQCDIYINVKRAGEHLQVDQIAFAVLHPAYERRLAFSLIGLQGPTGQQNAYIGNFGYPCTAREHADFDIYFDKMHYDERHIWNDKAKTLQWAKDKLKQLGVTLE